MPLARHLLRVRDLIDRAYAEPLDVDALARSAWVSPSYFRRSFKAAFGETPYRYLMSRRERAKALLRAGELSITEVCHEVGFTSLGSFDQIGSGPPLILVSGAACDRRVDTPLAEVLAERFTVLTVAAAGTARIPGRTRWRREVADIAALVDVAGGTAILLGGHGPGTGFLRGHARLPGRRRHGSGRR